MDGHDSFKQRFCAPSMSFEFRLFLVTCSGSSRVTTRLLHLQMEMRQLKHEIQPPVPPQPR